MNKNYKNYAIGTAIVLVLVIGVSYFLREDTGPSKLDDFAKCIKDKGFKFYGAFWCPHCGEQKKLFGSAKQYLPYIECSTPNAMGQTAECDAKGIKSYPTWEFPDGTMVSKVFTLKELEEKSLCKLPVETK